MKLRIFCAAVVCGCTALCTAVEAQEDWKEYRTTHFIIDYRNAPEDFVRRTGDQAEHCYTQIAETLGFTRFNFWLWDNRAHIYIYDNAQEYQQATGNPSWSGGAASSSDKIIYTFQHARNFLETTLPHEMGHIIFREFVGNYNPAVPLWLEEAVASYQERGKYGNARGLVREALAKGEYIPLGELSSSGAMMLLGQEEALLFYAEAFSVLEFLMQEYGRDAFVTFCQNLRDKQNLDRAIRSAYPFGGMDSMEKAWLQWVKR